MICTASGTKLVSCDEAINDVNLNIRLDTLNHDARLRFMILEQ